MVNLIYILLFIGLLILAHEWGHFYAARKIGVKVEEFGFGFPPRLYSFLKNGVRYSFNLLPFGGFVKIFGEHGEGEGKKESFVSRSPSERFLILSGGVFMNFMLAWLFFAVVAAVGFPQISEDEKDGTPVSVVAVIPGSPAEKSGLKLGDKIIEMKSAETSLRVETEKDVRDFVDAYKGENVEIAVLRGGEILTFSAAPRIEHPEGEGPLGIVLARTFLKRFPWYLAPLEGFKTLSAVTSMTIDGLVTIIKEIAVEKRVSAAVTGPVGIFFLAEDARSLGLSYFLQFMGVISVNLAVLNFLPIPALDGGRALFLAVEKIKGKRLDVKVENFIHTMGFAALLFLLLAVTYKDVAGLL